MSHNAVTSKFKCAGFQTKDAIDLCLKKQTFLKTSFFSRKKLESKSLAEVQFVIDSCRLVSQSNYFEQF